MQRMETRILLWALGMGPAFIGRSSARIAILRPTDGRPGFHCRAGSILRALLSAFLSVLVSFAVTWEMRVRTCGCTHVALEVTESFGIFVYLA
jgi:hypothetical protein